MKARKLKERERERERGIYLFIQYTTHRNTMIE
jgi:hypothetical protein